MKKHITPFIALLSAIVLLFSCKKSADAPSPAANLPVVATITVSAITQMSASCGGSISSDGGSAVTFRGFC